MRFSFLCVIATVCIQRFSLSCVCRARPVMKLTWLHCCTGLCSSSTNTVESWSKWHLALMRWGAVPILTSASETSYSPLNHTLLSLKHKQACSLKKNIERCPPTFSGNVRVSVPPSGLQSVRGPVSLSVEEKERGWKHIPLLEEPLWKNYCKQKKNLHLNAISCPSVSFQETRLTVQFWFILYIIIFSFKHVLAKSGKSRITEKCLWVNIHSNQMFTLWFEWFLLLHFAVVKWVNFPFVLLTHISVVCLDISYPILFSKSHKCCLFLAAENWADYFPPICSPWTVWPEHICSARTRHL